MVYDQARFRLHLLEQMTRIERLLEELTEQLARIAGKPPSSR